MSVPFWAWRIWSIFRARSFSIVEASLKSISFNGRSSICPTSFCSFAWKRWSFWVLLLFFIKTIPFNWYDFPSFFERKIRLGFFGGKIMHKKYYNRLLTSTCPNHLSQPSSYTFTTIVLVLPFVMLSHTSKKNTLLFPAGSIIDLTKTTPSILGLSANWSKSMIFDGPTWSIECKIVIYLDFQLSSVITFRKKFK